MSARATLIINELAPSASSCDWTDLVRRALDGRAALTTIRAANFSAVNAAARRAAERGDELLFAVGGDGTVNTCVNAIGDAETRVVVVPAGTANDLARLVGQLGDNGQTSEAGAITELAQWQPRCIDAISVNGRRFYTVGGSGWAADVAHLANRCRATRLTRRLFRALGSKLYTLACVLVILFSRRLGGRLRVVYTDAETGMTRRMVTDAYGVVVANTSRVGESFYLTPTSVCDDGKFELIVFPKRGRLRLLWAVMLMKKNRLFELPEICSLQVTAVTMTFERPIRFFGEGETFSKARTFDLALSEYPLQLLAPAVGASA